MRKLNKKTLVSDNSFELINDESSLVIQGGINGYQSDSNEQKESENIWQKATSILDDLI
jgi:hypothetical protein